MGGSVGELLFGCLREWVSNCLNILANKSSNFRSVNVAWLTDRQLARMI